MINLELKNKKIVFGINYLDDGLLEYVSIDSTNERDVTQFFMNYLRCIKPWLKYEVLSLTKDDITPIVNETIKVGSKKYMKPRNTIKPYDIFEALGVRELEENYKGSYVDFLDYYLRFIRMKEMSIGYIKDIPQYKEYEEELRNEFRFHDYIDFYVSLSILDEMLHECLDILPKTSSNMVSAKGLKSYENYKCFYEKYKEKIEVVSCVFERTDFKKDLEKIREKVNLEEEYSVIEKIDAISFETLLEDIDKYLKELCEIQLNKKVEDILQEYHKQIDNIKLRYIGAINEYLVISNH